MYKYKVKVSGYVGKSLRAAKEVELGTTERVSKKAFLEDDIIAEEEVIHVAHLIDGTFPECLVEWGFFHPGHQFRGKKHQVQTEEDLDLLYDLHPVPRQKLTATVYLYANLAKLSGRHHNCSMGKSKKLSDDADACSSRVTTDVLANKITYFDQVKRKHDGKGYSVEQMEMWAYLLASGKHNSFDEPPKRRFFRTGNSRQPESSAESADKVKASAAGCSQSDEGSSNSTSFAKRGQLLKQLKDLTELKNVEALTCEEYEKERKKMADELALLSG